MSAPTHRLPEESILHRRPWGLPLVVFACLVWAFWITLETAKKSPWLRSKVVELADYPEGWRVLGILLSVGFVLFGLLEQVRRFSPSKRTLAGFLRFNRAVMYGMALTGAGLSWTVMEGPDAWISFLDDRWVQGRWLGVLGMCTAISYVVLLQPVKKRAVTRLPSLARILQAQRASFDFVLGTRCPEDWEFAEHGPEDYVVWPETGLYGNLLALGQIGSGKTSELADPLIQQAFGKFPTDPDMRPSVFVMDLKGNQSARYYKWACAFGRSKEFRVLRPDIVKDAEGREEIAHQAYTSFNALSGWDEPDLLALELVDALESTKSQPSHPYYLDVQKEFLTHTLRVLTGTVDGEVDLGDLAAFVSDHEVRNTMLRRAQEKGVRPDSAGIDGLEASFTYFAEEFGAMEAREQASLLRGLAAQLTLLTNRAIQACFCPKRDGEHRTPFVNWEHEILDQPRIVVFSCPPAKYTDSLSRLLGLLVLKSFQQAMLRRTDAGFQGNRQRPVVLAIDEMHAFVNQRLGDFMSVSREARVSSWLLTQSIDQIPEHFRGTVLSNCRTRVMLQVSGETAHEMSSKLGTVIETQQQVSYSEGLQGAHDAALRERKVGDRKSITASRSFVEKERARFAPNAIQHLQRFKGVVHMFDGERLRPSEMMRTIPWYRLPFYQLNPLKHRNVACKEGALHAYVQDARALTCSRCGHRLEKDWEIDDWKRMKPALLRLHERRGSA